MKNSKLSLYWVFFELWSTDCFKLVPSDGQQTEISLDVGKTFHMECKADDHYEYCLFEHNGNKVALI